MKKQASRTISNPERNARRMLRLTSETVRLLHAEALIQVVSGCNSTTDTTLSPPVSKAC